MLGKLFSGGAAELVKGVGGVEKKDFTKVIEFQLDILKKFSKELCDLV